MPVAVTAGSIDLYLFQGMFVEYHIGTFVDLALTAGFIYLDVDKFAVGVHRLRPINPETYSALGTKQREFGAAISTMEPDCLSRHSHR